VFIYYIKSKKFHSTFVAGKRHQFQFEEDFVPDQESDTSYLDENDVAFRGMNSGKINFADGGLTALDSGDFTGLTGPEILLKHMELAETALYASWKLATSYTDPWTCIQIYYMQSNPT
jgi:hypothetical protein